MNNATRVEYKAFIHRLVRGLYRDVRGIALSHEARRELSIDLDSAQHLTYGEVVSNSFELLLIETVSQLRTSTPLGQRVFVDLGSGTGKAVLTAACFSEDLGLGRAVGIELMSPLHETAEAVVDHLRSHLLAPTAAAKEATIAAQSHPVAATATATARLPPRLLLLQRIHAILASSASGPEMSLGDLSNALHNPPASSSSSAKVQHQEIKAIRAYLKASPSFLKLLQRWTRGDGGSDEGGGGYGGDGTVLRDSGEGPELVLRVAEGGVWMVSSISRAETVSAITDSLSVAERVATAPAQASYPLPARRAHDPTCSILASASPTCLALLRRSAAMIEFHRGSFLPPVPASATLPIPAAAVAADPAPPSSISWTQYADIVYAASLLFPPPMMAELSAQVAQMKSGAIFISLKPLPEGSPGACCCREVGKSFWQMSWQKALVYVYVVI